MKSSNFFGREETRGQMFTGVAPIQRQMWRSQHQISFEPISMFQVYVNPEQPVRTAMDVVGLGRMGERWEQLWHSKRSAGRHMCNGDPVTEQIPSTKVFDGRWVHRHISLEGLTIQINGIIIHLAHMRVGK